MADFRIAVAFTLGEEGGYGNDKRDAGGETYRGIARNEQPGWVGWHVIDAIKLLPAWQRAVTNAERTQLLAASAPLQDEVLAFYQASFWTPLYGQITDQAVATKIFDLGVNEGRHEISLLVQRAVNDLGQGVAEDGSFGNGTLKAVNACEPAALLAAIKKRANDFYDELEKEKPGDRVFDATWRRRVNA